MTVAGEIRAQREAILAGRWVKYKPYNTGEACLVLRVNNGHHLELPPAAVYYISQAIVTLHPDQVSDFPWADGVWAWGLSTDWNDERCPDEHAAVTVLEYAEKLAEVGGHHGDSR